jgi:quercetin dioxygenase-like cupin family protein
MDKSLVALAVGALVISPAYVADDLCSVGPQHCKVLKEDGKVRVIDYTANKGDKVGMHSHPAHVVYIIKGGKTKFILPDGSTRIGDAKDGDALINPAVTHATENIDYVHAIIVEIKE